MPEWVQDGLFEWSEPYTVPPFDFMAEDISVRMTDVGTIRTYQGRMGKGSDVWKPSPGRQLPYLVYVGERMVGIGLLSSCVLNLRARDARLDLPKDPSERGTALRNYMDLAVAISVQPLGWHWNLGKLVALIAPTLGDEFRDAYGDELLGVTTTSLWGRSSQYNRIYEYLGHTLGNGVIHVPQAERDRMRHWCQVNAPEEWAALEARRRANAMNVVQLYAQKSGDKTWSTFHGQQRGIYYHATDPTVTRDAVIRAWYERWGRPRWMRTRDQKAPYRDGTVWHKRKLTAD